MIAPVNRTLALASIALLMGAAVLIVGIPSWTPWDLRPGSVLGQLIGISAGILLLFTLRYLFVRRSDRPHADKPGAQKLHALLGTTGVALALVHSQAALREWSALVLLAAIGLLLTGLYGRLISPGRVGRSFGGNAVPYLASGAGTHPWSEQVTLQQLNEKRRILSILDGSASESRFVLRLHHWLRHPRLAFAYHRLSRREYRLRASQPNTALRAIPLAERLWRQTHLILALLFVAGLFAHLITVLFFAGYVADGREIYWWHFTAW